MLGVCFCLSWSSFTGWRGDFGWTHTDVRCGDWVSTVPRVTVLVGDFPMSVRMVSASGLAKHSPFQPDCFQPSLVLLAVQLFYCTLLRVLSNDLLEWVKKLLKFQDSAWFLGSPLVLYLRPLRVLWLSDLKLEHCYISCKDCLAFVSADGCRPHPFSLGQECLLLSLLAQQLRAGCVLCAGQQGLAANSRAGQNFVTFKEDFLVTSVCLHLHTSKVLVGSRCPSNNTL